MITRRDFLKLSGAVGASLFVSGKWFSGHVHALVGPGIASWQTKKLTKWVDRLPIMPVAAPPALGGGTEIDDPLQPGKKADYYSMECIESEWQFHSDLPPARTNSYSYAGAKLEYAGVGAPISGYLGSSIVAVKNKAVVLDMANKLPLTPLYADAYDNTLGDGRAGALDAMGMPLYPNTSRIAIHLHGGFVPPQWDGHPDSWFGPDGSQGMRYASLPNAPTNGARYWYPNQQGPCLLWYHDHSMYQTRLNPFSGQAAGYVIIDGDDTVVPGLGGLNVPKFPYDVPLVIQDRTFFDDGSMFYPTASGKPACYPHPVWQPEYFGDTPVVNGKAYPYLEVEPRRYRLRFLNGSQARVYELAMGNKPLWLIGTEQGLLPHPVKLNKIVLAPAERADVIVDFGGNFGDELALFNTANAPYPNGSDVAIPKIMMFRVTKRLSGKDTTTPPQKLVLPSFQGILPPPEGTPIRDWVLKEDFDDITGEPKEVKINGLYFDEPIEEFPKRDSTEIWNYVNLTEDAHPMHPHLIKFQVLGRIPLDVEGFTEDWFAWIDAGRNPATRPQALNYALGPLQAPGLDEIGWKDTVRASVGMITQIAAKFEIPPASEMNMDGGYEYVHHCHILEHEENEMMRPYAVIP